MNFFNKIIELFSTQKYMDSIFEGLKSTVIVSVGAMILGLFLGTLVALAMISRKTKWTVIPKAIAKVYVTVINGAGDAEENR